ncbi:hypothetical protein BC829DRAFT_385057 [Chytridium lagenaria]|nr:hypothetical protein BC829DRAFT_385057 [Chytridium lagenaria]
MTAEIRSPKRTRGFVDSRKVHLKRLHEYQVLTSSRFDGQTEDGSFAVSLNVQKEVTLSTAQTPLYVELGIERNHPVSGSIRVVRVGLYEARRYCFQAKTTTGSLRRETEIEMVPVTDTIKVKLSPEGHASLRIPLPSPLEILPSFKSKNIHVYHVLGVTVSYNALYPSSSPTSLASSSDDSETEKSDTSSFWKGIRSFVGPKWVVKDSGFACSVRLLLDTTNPQFE